MSSNFQNIFSKYPAFESHFSSLSSDLQNILSQTSKYNTNDHLKKIFSLIDLTSLNTTDTISKILQMVDQINDFPKTFPDFPSVAAICVYPSFVSEVKENLISDPKINIASVCASFPSSQTFLSVKKAECTATLKAGADELDIVLSLKDFLDDEKDQAFQEIKDLKKICGKKHLKVILESGILKKPELIYEASILAMEAGADFIKTSTGKMEPAATLEAIFVMAKAIELYNKTKNVKIGIKPAGGIGNWEEALKYYTVVSEILGSEYQNNHLFRIGASKLANNLLGKLKGENVDYYGEKPIVQKREKKEISKKSKKIKKK